MRFSCHDFSQTDSPSLVASSSPAAVLKMMMMTETSLTIEILTSCFVFEIPNSHLIKREATGAARSSESTPEYGAA